MPCITRCYLRESIWAIDLCLLISSLMTSSSPARVVGTRLSEVSPEICWEWVICRRIRSPILGYNFNVPLLEGEHVTEDTGTGFVHTAPSHGRDDFDIWTATKPRFEARGIDTRIPYTVDGDGFFTEEVPGFTGRRVIDDKGNKGDANEAVIKALSQREICSREEN